MLKLPIHAWLPVHTKKLRDPLVAWLNADRFTAELAREEAYCMQMPHEPSRAYCLAERIQYADRYGGHGVGYCGGSARCGVYQDIQIKGVGRNGLHGVKPDASLDPWHSSGTVTASEAAREAIWSGVFQSALPYGAVPNLAIVLTGTRTCSADSIASQRNTPALRALLMRAPALRPAHFLRNLRFAPRVADGPATCADTVRTRAAIQLLASAFAKELAIDSRDASSTQIINEGLKQMARRFAAQCAASFAKRLFHRGFGCANIALDGRFLDFGIATTVTAYRRQTAGPGPSGPEFCRQHLPLMTTLQSLQRHVARYLRCPDIASLLGINELTQIFDTALTQRSEMELLKMTGLAEANLNQCPSATRAKVAKVFQRVYSRGATEPYTWRKDDDECVDHLQPIINTGTYDLNKVLSRAGQCSSESELRTVVSEELARDPLADEFSGAYRQLTEYSLTPLSPYDRDVARRRIARQAKRLNADISFLSRDVLDSALTVFDHEPEGISRYIDKMVQQARSIVESDLGEDLDDEKSPPSMSALSACRTASAVSVAEPARALHE